MTDRQETRDNRPNRPQNDESTVLLGRTGDDQPVYYDTERHVELAGTPEPEEAAPPEERDLSESTTVADVIDRIEEEVGWDELTDAAREYLPGDENESEGESGGEDGGDTGS